MSTQQGTQTVYGRNVAQVKPMVHAPVVKALPTQHAQPGAKQVDTNLARIAGHSFNTGSVPPGRYKYNTAMVNGQQGVFLVPIADTQDQLTEKGLFVPFTPSSSSPTVTPNIPVPKLSSTPVVSSFNPAIPPSAFTVAAASQQVNYVTSVPSTNVSLPMNSQANFVIQATAPAPKNQQDLATTTIPVGVPIQSPPQIHFPGKMLLTPGNSLIPGQNVPGSSSIVLINQPNPAPTTPLVTMAGTPEPHIILPAQDKAGTMGAKALYSLVQQHNKSVQQRSGHQTVLQTLVECPNPSPSAGQKVLFPVKGTGTGKSSTTKYTIVYRNKPQGKAEPTASLSKLSVGQTTHVPALHRETVQMKKPVGTLLIQKPTTKQDAAISIPTSEPSSEKHESTGKLLASNIKQENLEDTDSAPETEDIPFKIDSVFSLCQTDSPSNEVQGKIKSDPDGKQCCSHNDVAFVVLENLDLQGLSSVDVRKLRKLTGRRQSCSNQCRERTIHRLCNLQKLYVKDCIPPDPLATMLLSIDVSMKEKRLKKFKKFLEHCKPAPISKKLKMFRLSMQARKAAKKKTKMSATSEKSESKTLTSGAPKQVLPPRYVVGADKMPMNPDHALASKAVSLLNPGSKPVHGWVPVGSTSPLTQPMKPVQAKSVQPPMGIDTNSPAFQKAVSTLGSKKFFLIRVEGKNILIPVEQNSVQPRAYVLGDEKGTLKSATVASAPGKLPSVDPSQSSSSVVVQTPVSNPNPGNTQIKVKTEPIDPGYDKYDHKKATNIASNVLPVSIKEEPTSRGYSDEVTPPTTDITRKRAFVSSSHNTPLVIPQTPTTSYNNPLAEATTSVSELTANSNPMSTAVNNPTSTADRIRKLKEMLKKQEEDLERIKKRRIEDAVDVSEILGEGDS